MPRVDEARIAPVRVGERAPQSIRVGRHDDDMNVVGHEAIGPDLGSGPGHRFGQQLAIQDIIAILEEGLLAPVTALGDVVGQARQYEARKANHVGGYGAGAN
jgi:hypothetical protein